MHLVYPQKSVEHPPDSGGYLPESVEHPPGSVEHPPGSVEHPPGSVEHPPDAVSLLQKSSETSEEQPCALRALVRSFPTMALLSHSRPASAATGNKARSCDFWQ